MANQPMAGAGNIVPVEIKRLRGNPGHAAMPDFRDTQPLASSHDIDMTKYIPSQLQEPGISAWLYIWKAGATWISPQTDAGAVTRLCELADLAATMKAKFFETGELCYSKEYLAATEKEISLMRDLGLTPAARTKLGVAEVKSASRLHQLRMLNEREQQKLADQRVNGK